MQCVTAIGRKWPDNTILTCIITIISTRNRRTIIQRKCASQNPSIWSLNITQYNVCVPYYNVPCTILANLRFILRQNNGMGEWVCSGQALEPIIIFLWIAPVSQTTISDYSINAIRVINCYMLCRWTGSVSNGRCWCVTGYFRWFLFCRW